MVILTVLAVIGAGVFAFGSGRWWSKTSKYATAWDPRVVDIVHFVETDRGHSFRHPVKVQFLSDAAFKTRVGGSAKVSASTRRQVQDAVGAARALGFIHGNVDLLAAAKQQVQDSVVGLYVETDKTVYVRGQSLTPYVRDTLAHELTHALQDQIYGLKALRSLKTADPDAITALVEGDAMRVQADYFRQMSASDQGAFADEDGRLGDAANSDNTVPSFMQEGFQSPYAFGPVFIKALYSSGGIAAVDGAFQFPPTVDAQIIDPFRYQDRTPVAKLPAPIIAGKPDGHAQPFGLVTSLQVVGAGVDYRTARNALSGWQGDNSRLYKQAGRICVAVTTAFNTPSEADYFTAVINRQVAKTLPQLSAHQNGNRSDWSACDPGATAPAIVTPNPDAWHVLAARAALIGTIIDQSNPKQAACVADGLIDILGPAPFVADVNSAPGQLDRGALTTLVSASAQAHLRCVRSAGNS